MSVYVDNMMKSESRLFIDLKSSGVGTNVCGRVLTSSTDWDRRSGKVYINFTGPVIKPKFLSPFEMWKTIQPNMERVNKKITINENVVSTFLTRINLD